MLDSDQPDTTESDTGSTPEGTGTADTPPVVKKTTRKPAARRTPKKVAAAETTPETAPDFGTAPAAEADATPPAKKAPARRTAKKVAAPSAEAAPRSDASAEQAVSAETAPATKQPARRTATRKSTAKKSVGAAPDTTSPDTAAPDTASAASTEGASTNTAETAPAKKSTPRKSTPRKSAAAVPAEESTTVTAEGGTEDITEDTTEDATAPSDAGTGTGVAVLFQAPEPVTAPRRRTRKKTDSGPATEASSEDAARETAQIAAPSAADADEVIPAAMTDSAPTDGAPTDGAPTDGDSADSESTDDDSADSESTDDDDTDDTDGESATRRRRRRGGRRRRKPGEAPGADDSASDETTVATETEPEAAEEAASDDDDDNGTGNGEGSSSSSRRRRRRRRSGDGGAADSDDAPNTVTRVRQTRSAEDQITAVAGSTRLEAKKQRRREGREAGRRRAPIVSEAEFLARRESVDRVMVVRQREDLTQIAVLEDKVLVEHYVARESQTSLIGNVYLGRVQNVLPSMEAAFIDIGKGRNAVIYAGEVNWAALGQKEGQPRKIESVLQSGQSVLVQVTKDPIGHKGARLTSQVSLAGRFLVYVPDGTTSGISRKLPDTERGRLKTLLKDIVPDTAGVIVRTAAEGASEDELTRDVERLKARWEDIEKRSKGNAPQLLYGEPDLTLKVVRDLFTEDFAKLVIEGADAWDTVHGYVEHVAPDLAERLEKFERGDNGKDSFAAHRIDEQISKGLDRKVWLPSGGSLVIDRTEAMTVVDVNTGKFTGSGGNLEETVTKNNLESAEEIVRQLRLRDIGGIIVVDFIDMVLESNRDLVVRRLVECLGRDRTRHQVAEVTSLGLVQMTRKRIGTGLLEAFSESCDHCQGRGVVIKEAPVDPGRSDDNDGRRGKGRNRGRRGSGSDDTGSSGSAAPKAAPIPPSPKDVAAMARAEKPADEQADTVTEPVTEVAEVEVARAEVTEVEVEKVDVAEAGAEKADPTPPVEPTRPAAVTRTRRRSASRPAGPPVTPPSTKDAAPDETRDEPTGAPLMTPSSGVAGTRPTSGTIEPGTATVEPGAATEATSAESEETLVERVPVKKRDPRKR